MTEIIFWLCMAVVVWTYFGYPLTTILRGRLAGRPARTSASADPPDVTILLAVRNGADDLPPRLENLLAQNYPSGRLEIVVVCNGCTDGSEDVARAWAARHRSIHLLTSPAEEGKPGALNAGAAAATGQVLVFADVRQRFGPDAVQRLVEVLNTPGVGAVTGRLVVGRADRAGVAGLRTYWAAETELRYAEARTGSVMGATGAIYAMWRHLFTPVPPGTLLDDVYLPVKVALAGHRVAMAYEAVAFDPPSSSDSAEYRRRVRTFAGNFQLVRLIPELLNPANPLFVRYISHKLLRSISPVFFLGLVLTGFLLSGPWYTAVAVGLLFIYLVGTIGLLARHRLLGIPSAFVMVHAALFDVLLRPRRNAADLWVR